MSEQATMTDSVETNELADRLLRLMPRLQQWAASTVQANRREQDLSLRQLAVLYRIREGHVFPSSLARRLRISPAVVTGLLDRFEQRGYVRRRMDPGDRRRQRLVLTERGLAASLAVHELLSRRARRAVRPILGRRPGGAATGPRRIGADRRRPGARSPRLGPATAENDEMWEEESLRPAKRAPAPASSTSSTVTMTHSRRRSQSVDRLEAGQPTCGHRLHVNQLTIRRIDDGR